MSEPRGGAEVPLEPASSSKQPAHTEAPVTPGDWFWASTGVQAGSSARGRDNVPSARSKLCRECESQAEKGEDRYNRELGSQISKS